MVLKLNQLYSVFPEESNDSIIVYNWIIGDRLAFLEVPHCYCRPQRVSILKSEKPNSQSIPTKCIFEQLCDYRPIIIDKISVLVGTQILDQSVQRQDSFVHS